MNLHRLFAGSDRIVETCIVGSGAFGQSFLGQGRFVPRMNARVAVDISVERAAEAFRAVGFDASDISSCRSASEARKAWDAGRMIATDDVRHVLDLPIEVVVEATGQPEAGATCARLAIEAGKHVALVSKEVDSVVGPGLAHMAAERDLVVTPVDGDQPSLLIGLVSWAETLGLEIIAAGKSSEYDFVYDPASETITSATRRVEVPGFGALWEPAGRSFARLAAERAEAASALPQHAVPDLCELQIVANNTGLMPDLPELHAPIARISEVADLLTLSNEGGLLNGVRRIDVFNCLRYPSEVSFAGGVFVVVRCEGEATWRMLAEKGHVVSRSGTAAMLYLPRHLLGVEAATSVLAAALLGMSTGASAPRPFADLIAVADADLPAGHVLRMYGHHHAIDHVSGALMPAGPLADDKPLPFYIAAGRTLVRPVSAGRPILQGDVDMSGESELLELRTYQDQVFFA